MDPDPDTTPVERAFEESIKFARVAERLRAVIGALELVSSSVSSVLELDPELDPEVTVVLENITSSGEALTRALQFIDARADAKLTSLLDEAS